MKLIIDIDDKQVLYDIKNRGFEAKTETDKVIINALYNGIPLEEELKKIKAEMIAYRDNDKNDFDFEIGAINGVIAILDKYIHNEENKQ